MAKSNFIVRGGGDFSGLYKEFNKAQKKMNTFQKGIQKSIRTIGTIIGTVAIGKLVKDSVQAAMTVESSIAQLIRIMGQSANVFQNWANTQAKTFGMAREEAYKYGATYSNLISTFTTSTEETTKYTTELLKTSAVVASATGRTMEDTMERIRSGLLGNTEAIEDLGINVDVAMIESTKAFQQFANGRSWQDLTYQEQQQIRLMAILEQANIKYGDSLAGTTATKQQIFLATLKDIRLNLGQAFLPIYNVILPALTSLASKIEYVTRILAQFTQALFGKSTQIQTKQTQAQAKAVTELGDATEEAGQKAKGAIAGFDQINQLSLSQGGSGTSDTVSTVATPETNISTEEIAEPEGLSNIQKFAEKFKTALEPVGAAFERLKDAAEPVINNIGQGLKWFYDNVLTPFSSWVISEAIPAFLDLLASALSVLNPIIEAFKPIAQWLFNNFLKPIAKWTGKAFIKALNEVTETFRGLGNWMSKNKDIITSGLAGILAGILAYQAIKSMPVVISGVKTALAGLGTLFGSLLNPVGLVVAAIAGLTAAFIYFYKTNESFRNLVNGILNGIKNATLSLWQNVLVPFGQFLAGVFTQIWNGVAQVINTLWKNALVPFAEFLQWAWETVIKPFSKNFVDIVSIAFKIVADVAKSLWQNVLVPLADFLATIFVKVIQGIAEVFSYWWEKINILGNFLEGIFKPIIEGLVAVFQFLWQNVLRPLVNFIAGTFINTFDTIAKGIKGIIEGLKTSFVGLIDFLVGMFTGNWEKAWNGIKDIFKGVFDSLYAIVKTPLNLIIDAINTVIGGLNKLDIDIPEWVPKFGGESFGINIPKIPKLARGGIVDSPTIAMIGEAGKEAVVPLENTGFVTTLANAVGQAVASHISMSDVNSNDDKPIILELNGERLARAIIRNINTLQRKTGKTLLNV